MSHALSTQSEVDWYYLDGCESVGPFSWLTLQKIKVGGIIGDATMVRSSQDTEWRRLGSLKAADSITLTEEELIVAMLTTPSPSEPPRVNAKEFAIRFGTPFISSSAGFRGDGVFSVTSEEIEIRGRFSLPILVEFGGFVLILAAMFETFGAGHALWAVIGAFLIRAAYCSIPKRCRLTRDQVAQIIRLNDRLDIAFRNESPLRKIRLRAASADTAQQIEAALQ